MGAAQRGAGWAGGVVKARAGVATAAAVGEGRQVVRAGATPWGCLGWI